MAGLNTYRFLSKCYSSFHGYCKAIMCLLFMTVSMQGLYAKTETSTNSSYADNFVTVSINVQGVGAAEVPAIVKDNVLLLSVTDVFDILKIKNSLSPNMDALTGFIVDEKASFLIDVLHSRITYKEKTTSLKPEDLVQTESNIYLRSDYFGEIFGLECTFNFRNLSVTLTSKFELPAVREARIEGMRQNMSQLRGEQKADTFIKRTYPFFHFGAFDWNVISNQQTNGSTDNRVNLGLGAVVAGGETSLTLNYNSVTPIEERQQYYYWRYANNDNQVVKQVGLGKLFTPLSSSVYAPLVGAEVTNTPTSFRRSFGTYTLSNTTQPNWMVELYVNNVLVDYKRADANGFYTFQVPLVYGNTVVKLRFYGPYGEERTQEQNINIPFNFMPSNTLEYDASAGYVEDGHDTRFSRTVLNYGVNRHVTIGGGMEYLSSVTSGAFMPFANASVMITPQLLATGDYIHNVRSKGLLTYTTPGNIQLELVDIKYTPGQTAINLNYLEERKASLNIPVRFPHVALFSRLTLDDITLPETRYTNAQWLVSGAVFGVNANITTYASFYKNVDPFYYSVAAFSVRLPKGFILTPQVQYAYQQNGLISVKGTLEKYFMGKGYFNMYYEEDVKVHMNSFGVGIRYDFTHVQLATAVNRANNNLSVMESARGSIVYDSKTGYKNANIYVGVGRGEIAIIPFLDLNCDGKRDENEPLAYGLKFHTNGGRIDNIGKDTVIRILDLEPYTSYFINLDPNSFDNIAWHLQKLIYKVAVAPNQFTTVQIPISVFAEASGTVYSRSVAGEKEQGRIRINLYDNKGYLVNRAITDVGGYFSFENLAPGAYILAPDSAQLAVLKLSTIPASVKLNINPNKDGDVIDKIKFVLVPLGDTVSVKNVIDSSLKSNFGIADTLILQKTNLHIDGYEQQKLKAHWSPLYARYVRHQDFIVPLSYSVVPFPGNLGLYLFRNRIATFLIRRMWAPEPGLRQQ